ncbi:hypothetical protein EV189_3228 [Motilibacter rhizosphaerae]|uniref:Pre-peptidase n=1 Tax=Motilibacter rhizosphaerae TaxID=598652 RepID=A0A4V2F3E5_9ACTN|nr:hypothetical protein [Motilibacter rhizosphaerae]RZS82833.1 hypothetical protein EV189_3228 [Motilibacter rhizosphaerae]
MPSPRSLCSVVLGAALLVLAGPALAAPAVAAEVGPPPGDAREAPVALRVPGTVRGTTVGATVDAVEPLSSCGATGPSVWYAVTPPADRAVVLRLQADGQLDAQVTVFGAVRSRLSEVACDTTDDQGRAATAFRPAAGAAYLVRVAALPGSAPGAFTLGLLRGPAPATPPGHPLPHRGARVVLDRVLRPTAAYWLPLVGGRTYVLDLVAPAGCASLQLFAPGTTSFDQAPRLSTSCGGAQLFTPPLGASGRWVALLTADAGVRSAQPVALLAGPAGRDDVAPGLPLPEHRRLRGSVGGASLDAVDVYHFDVARRSVLDLDLAAPASRELGLDVRTDAGRPVAGATGSGALRVAVRLPAGHYVVAVRAAGPGRAAYALVRSMRAITSTRTTVEGRASAVVAPGRNVAVRVAVAPAASGRAVVTVERLDPFSGWQPYALLPVRVVGGSGTVSWHPPTTGRWRFRAQYSGTSAFAPSASGTAGLQVAAPLRG